MLELLVPNGGNMKDLGKHTAWSLVQGIVLKIKSYFIGYLHKIHLISSFAQ